MIKVEEVKLDFEEEAKAPKKAKSELVFKKRIVPIESVSKIEELKKRVKIYFKFVPNKMMLSYKGLVYIFDDSQWPETYKKFPKEKLKKLNEERESNNEIFFKCYLDAISEERTKPLKVKIFECEGKALLIRWIKFKYIINFEGSFSHILN